MRISKYKSRKVSLNLTSLIDVLFILIIFFTPVQSGCVDLKVNLLVINPYSGDTYQMHVLKILPEYS